MNNILAEHLSDANVRFEVSLNTIIGLIDYIEANKKEQSKSIEPLLTQEEVIDILKVDSTTLWRWRNRGYLNALKVGGKLRYRQEDIVTLISEKGGADL